MPYVGWGGVEWGGVGWGGVGWGSYLPLAETVCTLHLMLLVLS